MQCYFLTFRVQKLDDEQFLLIKNNANNMRSSLLPLTYIMLIFLFFLLVFLLWNILSFNWSFKDSLRLFVFKSLPMTMSLSHHIKSRYSTKKFDPSKILPEEILSQVKELLRFSPSSVNSQPWHFFLVGSKEGKEVVARSTAGPFEFNTQKVLDASHVVVCCRRTQMDTDYLTKILRAEEEEGRYKKPELKTYVEKLRADYVKGLMASNGLENWMSKQVYLNVGMFLMGVATLGVDAVPVEGFDPKILDAELKLKEKNLSSVLLVPIGYRSSEDSTASLPKARLSEADVITIL